MMRLTAILSLVLSSVFGAGIFAQKNEPPVRTVHGEVVDKDNNPISTAVVQLRNLKTQMIQSYISDDKGEYRFSGLDPNLDYEIHAETRDMTSTEHRISSFDTRKDIDLLLKVDKQKPAK
jgi:Carboxypeptidase regulatory-like domain